MARTKKVKAAGKFGARYGKSVRESVSEIEALQRKKQRCIFCEGIAKRLAAGIWKCKKCGKKFASHAYFLIKKEI